MMERKHQVHPMVLDIRLPMVNHGRGASQILRQNLMRMHRIWCLTLDRRRTDEVDGWSKCSSALAEFPRGNFEGNQGNPMNLASTAMVFLRSQRHSSLLLPRCFQAWSSSRQAHPMVGMVMAYTQKHRKCVLKINPTWENGLCSTVRLTRFLVTNAPVPSQRRDISTLQSSEPLLSSCCCPTPSVISQKKSQIWRASNHLGYSFGHFDPCWSFRVLRFRIEAERKPQGQDHTGSYFKN